MELVFPHLHEIVLVNVSLVIVATNAGARRDGTVYQNRPHRNTCLTSKETVANLSFVITQEAFTSIVQTDASLLSGGTDKLHHPTEIVVGQLQFRVGGSPSHRNNGSYSPPFQADVNQKLLQLFQSRKTMLVHTGHHIEYQSRRVNHHPDGIDCLVETMRIATHPVMVIGKSVQADRCGMKSCCHQCIEPFAGKEQAIGHHAPWESPFINGTSTCFQVLSHQRFTTRYHHKYFMRVSPFRHTIQHPQEVLLRHIDNACRFLAIAPAMSAIEVTSQGTFPEKLSERMFFHPLILHVAGNF